MSSIVSVFKNVLKIKLVSDSFKVLTLRFIGVLLLFGVTLFITNNYNVELVGKYEFVRTLLFVLSSFCLLGTDQSILYFSGILKSNKTLFKLKRVYFRMLKILFFIAIFILALITVVNERYINILFSDSNIYPVIFKTVIVLFFYCLIVLNAEVIRAIDKIIISEIIKNVLKYIPFAIGVIALALIGKESFLIEVYLLGFVTLGILTTLYLFYLLKNFKTETTSTITSKEIIKKSYPIAISEVAIFLLMSIDVFFLKKYNGDADVAYYSIALKLMLILSVIINTININASSKIAELYNDKNFTELNKLLKNSARLIFLMSLPVVIIFFLFSKEILGLFGENYVGANTALLIMIISQGISTIFGSAKVYLNMTEKQKVFQYILISSVIINYFSNKLLIPIYGLSGAAISFGISLLWWNVISALYIYKKDNVKIFLR